MPLVITGLFVFCPTENGGNKMSQNLQDPNTRLAYPAKFLVGLAEELEDGIQALLKAYQVPENGIQAVSDLAYLHMLIVHADHPEEFVGGGTDGLDPVETLSMEFRDIVERLSWIIFDLETQALERRQNK
jgi:hypothetical protein